MPIPGFGEIAEHLRRGTVQIRAGRRGLGSGVVVDQDGVIVTNAHVAASSPIEVELWDGQRAQGTLVRSDASRDVAVFRVPLSGLTAVTLANSEAVRVGEAVIAVGNPLGFQGALTTGVIHAVGRVPALGPMKWIQADVRLAPGNSGGPLANARGQVVGINTLVSAGLGLAVPSNTVARQLEDRAGRASLGIVVRPVQIPKQGQSRLGVIVLEVIKDGSADLASLIPGDVLIGAEGCAFESIEDLEQILERPGERVAQLQFLRGKASNVRTAYVRLAPSVLAAA